MVFCSLKHHSHTCFGSVHLPQYSLDTGVLALFDDIVWCGLGKSINAMSVNMPMYMQAPQVIHAKRQFIRSDACTEVFSVKMYVSNPGLMLCCSFYTVSHCLYCKSSDLGCCCLLQDCTHSEGWLRVFPKLNSTG